MGKKTKTQHPQEAEERQELRHEAWPGYPRIFLTVLIVFTLYLLLIFLSAPTLHPLGH